MCGLVALAHFDHTAAEEPTLQRMLQTIVHRGPDDAGIWLEGPIGLGFRRLAILDLSPLGHQPMASHDERLTIVFNGEIYNYIELRRELQGLGHTFRSSGDTEVLLAAYRQWGSDCLQRLNGMWAFLIHDRDRNILFGSRDRFGIKPLYRWQDGRRAIFASEIKAIRASGFYVEALNLRSCAAFFHEARLDDTNETFFAGIEHLPAGHAFELDLSSGKYTQWPYWTLHSIAEAEVVDAPAAFAAMFEDAMRLHMRSDVPVGVNLSGGLDSTSILCAAARVRGAAGATDPLLAFCYMDPKFDERRYIDDTLAQTGAELVRLEMTPAQLWDSLPRVLSFQDEPVHSMTALVGFHLMGLAASRHVKVILNGQGADETIAGYGNYFDAYWYELARRGALGTATREIAAYAASHGGSGRQMLARTLRRTVQTALRSNRTYRALAESRRRRKATTQNWIEPELTRHLPMRDADEAMHLRAVLTRSVMIEPLPLYLRVEDRNSMAHSIEVRVPFLDHRLVTLLFSLKSAWKLQGPWNKFVLREGMRGRIPESVRTRVDKMGFPTNATDWFRGPLYERLRDVIHDRAFREQGMLRADALSRALECHRTGQSSHAGKLFAAVQFHVWRTQPLFDF